MKKESANITAQKYEEWIVQAFTKLLKEYSYQEITIKQITDQADISRQTFYRHFKSKEDIIELYSNTLSEEVSTRLNSLEDKSMYNIFYCYFMFWKEHTALLDLLKEANGEYLLSHYYNKSMLQTLNILRPVMPQYDEYSFHLIKSFLLGGLYQTKMQWQANNYKDSPAELATLISQFVC